MKAALVGVYPLTADYDARYILLERAGASWSDIIARPDTPIDGDALRAIKTDMARYIGGQPLSRIYGRREFWGLSFMVTPDTLDPRPDTETLVRAAVNRFKDNPPRRILDLGTGTGCIIVALLKEFPMSYGIAVDKSVDALIVAKENAAAHGVDNRMAFIQSDWAAALSDAPDDRFDLIVSNPPYISRKEIESLDVSVRDYDPILALEAEKNGLAAYEILIPQVKKLLSPRGHAFFEIGIGQADDVARIVTNTLSRVVDIYRDNANVARVVEMSNGDK